MKVELDTQHETMVAEAVARGHAPDASAYVQSLIDEAARDGFVEENREAIAALLRERDGQEGVERRPGDIAALRGRVLGTDRAAS